MAPRDALAHLLRRATFGPTAAELDAAERAGYDATLTRLLRPTSPDPGAARSPAPALGPDPRQALPEPLSREQRQAVHQRRYEQLATLTEWWLDRMVTAEHGLDEKLVFFWHGHWATSVSKVATTVLMQRQLDTFRAYGRGDFAAFVKAMVRDPALILWLDGHRNTLAAPNENLARELMELFTLGIGNYTEEDVKAGARALTGWGYSNRTTLATFTPRRFDAGGKTILGVTAAHSADSYVDVLVRQPANADFLAARLWARFAADTPIPAETRARLAESYRDGGRVVTTVLRALFTDPAFARTPGQLVKQPVEWLVGALRQLGVRPAELPVDGRRQLLRGLDGMDQVPLKPPSVGGWPAGVAWLTTSAALARLRLAELVSTQADRAIVDRLSAAPQARRPDELARLLVVDAWTDRTRDVLAGTTQARRMIALGLSSPEYAVH